MIVVGVSEQFSQNGKQLKDGSVCVLQNGEIIAAISEERLSRKKHDGGYKLAWQAISENLGIQDSEVDLWVTSSCCDDFQPAKSTNFITCGHHLSHACSAYYTSPDPNALVIVQDSGGNVLDGSSSDKLWENPREQASYYIGRNGALELVGADFDKASTAGLGEIYRACTYFLGWPSSTHANKTMALAGLNGTKPIEHEIFTLDSAGNIQTVIQNEPNNPIGMISSLLSIYGLDMNPRNPGEAFEDNHIQLAAWVQTQLEKILIDKISHLKQNMHFESLCLSGGVAYNCRLLEVLQIAFPGHPIHVSPASGDHGQALGNALYGYYIHSKQTQLWAPQKRQTPYLGLKRDSSQLSEIKELLKDYPGQISCQPIQSPPLICASKLANYKSVGWFQGRSEFGPRALGNRSILASPFEQGVVARLNKMKGREAFLPFALSITDEEICNYFESTGSPYMSFTATASKESSILDHVLHADRTSRVQSLAKEDNPRYFELLTNFKRHTGFPGLLNTSFNAKSEPIVETPLQALDTMFRLKLDHLVLDDILISQQVTNSDQVWYKSDNIFEQVDFQKLGQFVQDSTGLKIEIRDRFLLNEEFVGWLLSGRKITTVRFTDDCIAMPISSKLPLLSTTDFKRTPSQHLGEVVVHQIEVKKFCDLTELDAYRDGFESFSTFTATLKEIYPEILNQSYVTIFQIEPLYGNQ